MTPSLYMVELAVANLPRSVAWYRDVVGFQPVMIDPAGGFALLKGLSGCPLALKVGLPVPGGVIVHLEVPDLVSAVAELSARGAEVGLVKASEEGYRRAMIRDPDGYSVAVFEWVGRG